MALKETRPQPAIWLLVGIGCAYLAFHAIRGELSPGFLRESFPSLLTPPGMFGVIELMPGVRFRSRPLKWLVLGVTTLMATVWLEAVVPRWTDRASGDWPDSIAMALGLLLFCLYDWCWGRLGDA